MSNPDADALARVRAFGASLSLPALSPGELLSAACEHYNATTKGARSEDIIKVLEGSARQQDWIERRELDFLRAGIAAGNPELVKLMQASTSAVKGTILDAIYAGIGKAYPALAPLATQVVARKKEELSLSEPPSSTPRKGVAIELEIEETPESSVPYP